MSEALAVSRPSMGISVYKWLVELYPESYRQEFGEQMMLAVEDLYQDELAGAGSVGFGFWLRQIVDVGKGVVGQHLYVLGGMGMKNYLSEEFGLTGFHIVSIALLLPFLFVLALDFGSRIAQGNLGHPNDSLFRVLNRTWLYAPHVLFVWIVLFPIVAALLALLPLAIRLGKRKPGRLGVGFLKENAVSLAIMVVGIGCVGIILFHDFAPCMVHGVLSHGLNNFSGLVSVCRKA